MKADNCNYSFPQECQNNRLEVLVAGNDPEVEPPEPEAPPVEPIVGSDADNANQFISEHGENIRWCEALDYWLTWDGRRWKRDNNLEVERLAEKTARALIRLSAKFPHDKAEHLAGVGLRLLEQPKMIKMIEAAKRKREVPESDLDNDRGFLTVANGVINLRTGKRGSFDKFRMSTRMTNIIDNPSAKCPKWNEFLLMIMGGDEEMVGWLQRAVGYSLTGEGDAKMFAYLYGGGDNGKSTFLEMINIVSGEYSQKSSIEALLAGQRSKEQKNTPYTAALRGARFVYTDEMLEGGTLNSSLMKDLTGGDKLTGMGKYQDPITFQPTHFLWLYGNNKPDIRDSSDAMWGRVKLVKFGVTIPVEQRKPMNEVKAMFLAELPGILSWGVQGAIRAYQEGVGTTDSINIETKEYRDDEDIVGRWFKEKCIQDPTSRVDKHIAYKTFCAWAEQEGIAFIPQLKTFTQRLTKLLGMELGGHAHKDYKGFRLATTDVSLVSDCIQEEVF